MDHGKCDQTEKVRQVVSVARSKQVYIGWLEATVLSIYLPEEKRTFICVFDLPCCLKPPYRLRPVQLNPYEPVSSNRNATYSQQLGSERRLWARVSCWEAVRSDARYDRKTSGNGGKAVGIIRLVALPPSEGLHRRTKR